MILYFTGTGNSLHIARNIAALTGDGLVSLNERIKAGDHTTIDGGDRLVFVLPTYAWQIPWVVRDWIRATLFTGRPRVWFVMDCGGAIGGAGAYNEKLCAEKNFKYMGTAQVVMPENYIAMFNAPEKLEARAIVAAADPVVSRLAETILRGQAFREPKLSLADRLESGPVNKLFYPLFVKAKAFQAGDGCVGCGRCVERCPLNNIRLAKGRPVWGNHCTHCMACICYCPTEAIEYGKKSVGKPRYRCEK